MPTAPPGDGASHARPAAVRSPAVTCGTGASSSAIAEAGNASRPVRRVRCRLPQMVVVVLRGRGEVRMGGDAVSFAAPCTLIAPPGVAHQIVNVGTEPLEAVAAMRVRSSIATADGVELALPWRE
jgi:hypothetical protein